MAGKGAPAAKAAPAAAAANGAGPIPVIPAPPPMMGDKTIPQVQQETTDLIAETMKEIADDPDPWGTYNEEQEAADKGKGGKGKKGKKGKAGKPKKEEAEDADPEGAGGEESDASDDAEADSDDGETDAGDDDGEDADEDAEAEEDEDGDAEAEEDEGEAHDGKSYAGKRRALKNREKRINEFDKTVKAAAAQNESDATLLSSLFGDAITALNGVKLGDSATVKAAIEATLAKFTGLSVDEAIVFLVDPSKAPSAADLKLRKLEKERADERAAETRRGEDAAKAKATQDATVWIEQELKTDPSTKKLLKLPGFVASTLQQLVDGYSQGVTTPKKAAAKVVEQLKATRKLLNEAFRGAKEEPEEEPEEKPRNGKGKRGRGSPPRQGVTRNASSNARTMTTGDAIIDTLLEEGMIKSTDPRVLALRGKKVGVA